MRDLVFRRERVRFRPNSKTLRVTPGAAAGGPDADVITPPEMRTRGGREAGMRDVPLRGAVLSQSRILTIT